MTYQIAPLAGNSRVNERIHELLPLLVEQDQRKFVKKFKAESAEQAGHTFRELVLGAFLLKQGFAARHEVLLDGKTPDWVIYSTSGHLVAVVDQITFHQARALDDEINSALRAGETWEGWLPDNTPRLYQKLHAKAQAYQALSKVYSAAYIVAMFADFNASVDSDEFNDALYRAYDGGVFAHNSNLTGVIYFTEAGGQYPFKYFSNPHSHHSLQIADNLI